MDSGIQSSMDGKPQPSRVWLYLLISELVVDCNAGHG